MKSFCSYQYLLNKYEPMLLMIYQGIFEQIEKEAEEKVNRFINYQEDIKTIYIAVWVNAKLHNFFRDLKQAIKFSGGEDIFKYIVDCTQNLRMRDNEFKIYNINIRIEDKYPFVKQEDIKGDEETNVI